MLTKTPFGSFSRKFESAAMLAGFAVSAVGHDCALAVCLSNFYPLLFMLFCSLQWLLTLLLEKAILEHHGTGFFFLGPGVILCFYSWEQYTHWRWPSKHLSFLDYAWPSSWTCPSMFWKPGLCFLPYHWGLGILPDLEPAVSSCCGSKTVLCGPQEPVKMSCSIPPSPKWSWAAGS